MKNKWKIGENGNKDALVIIDAEVDFVNPGGKLYVSGVDGESSGDDVVFGIIELNKQPFDYRVTSEDEHPPGHIEFDIFPPHCEKGKVGQEYVAVLDPVYESSDENLVKGDDVSIIAYSIATSKEFANHIGRLRAKGIKRIFVTGWAYTHCVGESAIAYASQGFETFVVRDLTRSVAPPYGDPEVMKQKLALYGVKEVYMADMESADSFLSVAISSPCP